MAIRVQTAMPSLCPALRIAGGGLYLLLLALLIALGSMGASGGSSVAAAETPQVGAMALHLLDAGDTGHQGQEEGGQSNHAGYDHCPGIGHCSSSAVLAIS